MNLVITGKNKNNDIVFEKSFNGETFYESTFVDVSLKLKLIEPPMDYFKNNLQGLYRVCFFEGLYMVTGLL